MPYITTKVTTPLPQKKIDALTEAYGKLIGIFPGKASAESCDKMTDAVCAMIEVECAIPADRVYVKYAEVEHWGWNHANF